jgi:hypothetical protein
MPNKREILFSIFSKNLSIVTSKELDVFFCPICEKGFTRDQVDAELTLAHIWPNKLGGTIKTLACKNCNHTVGSKIESHLTNYVKLQREGKYHYRATLNGGKEIYTGYAKFTKTKKGEPLIDSIIDVQNSNPKALAYFPKFNENNLPTINFEFNLKYNEHRIRLTYLHFAYLYLFHHFGYDWMRIPSNAVIREQLKNPEKEVFNPVVFDIPASTLKQFGQKPNEPFLVILLQPRDLIGFTVIAPQLSSQKSRIAIIFPTKSGYVPPKFAEMVVSLPIVATHHRLIEPTAERLCSKVMFDVLRFCGVAKNVSEYNLLIK